MPGGPAVELGRITPADLEEVGEFLHAHLNERLSARQWSAALVPPWPAPEPDHGFLLRAAGEVVGAYLAFYSVRQIGGATERFCNLAAWCVGEEYRSHGLRLLRAALGRKGYHFTDLSPSGNVVPLNLRLGFTALDTSASLVLNLPWPPRAGTRVVSEPGEIDGLLTGQELQVYRDHARAAAARHLVVVQGERTCYVIYRRDRRKRLPLFASILHVSDRELFAAAVGPVRRHLLGRGLPLTLAEDRVTGPLPGPAVRLTRTRSKMYRSRTLRPEQVDYLYSELTCVPW
ncbi:hypothetical protein [Georgenia muralis]